MTHADRIKLAEEHERFAQVLRQKDGTVVQYQPFPDYDWENALVNHLRFDEEASNYRLKPEPKYRPMTPDDFVGEPTIWITDGPSHCLVTGINASHLLYDSEGDGYCVRWGNLFINDTFKYSIDGRATWHRFRVEVTE